MANRAQVLDSNHRIERINYGSSEKFLPWYIQLNKKSRVGYAAYYYTRKGGHSRIECNTWLEAFDHIARSRRMLTSHHAGSNYVQEAENAGIIL